ncbi:MAG: hypothetical protein HYR85_14105 [Planctomycetes bacterium]|nr:hypothetical protein [Planctomycetota bacterium]MBI3845122.1 hypothetical protein [Planctomycetota bacterium]
MSDEGISGLENVALGEPGDAGGMKTCMMCLEPIPASAIRCRECGGQVGIWDGSVYREFFTLLFVNLWILGGTFLPWYGAAGVGMPRGIETLSGFVVAFVAFGAVCASVSAIWSRHLVFWPTLTNFFTVAFFCAFRFKVVWMEPNAELDKHISNFLSADWSKHLNGILNAFGPGYVICAFGALFILIFLVMSIVSGAKKAKEKKAAQDAAVAARRQQRTGK